MTSRTLPFQIDFDRVATFCRAHGIVRLSLFGSVLREDYDPVRSDVDVYVEFGPDALRQLGLGYFSLGPELALILGQPVDFVSNPRPWLRGQLIEEGLPIYVEAGSDQ